VNSRFWRDPDRPKSIPWCLALDVLRTRGHGALVGM
jgi:hypothetical protein